jgi:hypothetical protein
LIALGGCECGDLGFRRPTYACSTNDDCVAGYSCVGGFCAEQLVDAGGSDAGGSDAGLGDAGRSDAGIFDAGGFDAGLPITLVQAAEGKADAGGGLKMLTVNLLAPITTGNALIACVSWDTGFTGVTSLSGGGVTWVPAVSQCSAVARAGVYYGLASTGGTRAVTLVLDGGPDDFGIYVSEWSGIASSQAVEGASFNQASADGGPLTTGTVGAISENDLLFACGAQDRSVVTAGPAAAFTALPSLAPKDDVQEEAYRLPGDAGIYATSWSLNAPAAQWCGILVAFKRGP